MAILSMDDQNRLLRQLEKEFHAIRSFSETNPTHGQARCLHWVRETQSLLRLCSLEEEAQQRLARWTADMQIHTQSLRPSHHAA